MKVYAEITLIGDLWQQRYFVQVIFGQLCEGIVDYVKRCSQSQKFQQLHLAPPEELFSSVITWRIFRWGMDVLGPFPMASR